jgi:acylphosphatase
MNSEEKLQSLNITVKGIVQGVFFRASARDEAIRLGLSGWVRNTKEGNVEISVTGNGESLDEFLNWCEKGPPKAQVTDVISNDSEIQFYKGFTIKR